MKNENEMYERYIDELNKYLKTVDFKKLHLSVNSTTKNDYAKEVLKSITEIFESIYGKEPLTRNNFSMVEVPAIIYSPNNLQLHLGLVMLDIESSGEHWGSTFFTPFGIIEDDFSELTESQKKYVKNEVLPYNYWYTVKIDGDIHVDFDEMPRMVENLIGEYLNNDIIQELSM